MSLPIYFKERLETKILILSANFFNPATMDPGNRLTLFSVTLFSMSSIKISVLFFGQITDYTRINKMELNDFMDTDAVLNYLKSIFPELKESPYQMALDKEIIHENTTLTSTHTLALLPPYAGG